MIKKFIIVILSLALVMFFIFPIVFKFFYSAQLDKLSSVIETSVGPIEYRLTGEKGPVILFIHGTPGGHDQTMNASDHFRVLTPSRPGYLRTPLSAGKSPLEQAQAFKALLDALKIKKVVVIGVSGGGPSSMEFAAAYPNSTLGLIALEAVSFSEDFSEEDLELIEASDRAVLFSLLLVKALGAEFAATSMFPSVANQEKALSSPENIKLLNDLMWTSWPPSPRNEGAINDLEQFNKLALPLTSIKVPTIVIHGDEDINVDIEQAKFTTKSIQDAKLFIIKGADHFMFVTHADEIDVIVNDFISRVTL